MGRDSGREGFSLWSIAIPAYGPSLLFGLGEGAILPIIALSARGLGATVAAAALVLTLVGVGSLLSNIPASIITAKYGERFAMVGAAVLSIVALLLCIAAQDLWVYALGIALIGASAAVFNLARQSFLTEVVPVALRARAMSTLGGVMRIGIFAGPFLGALAIHLMGLEGAYWVAVLAMAGAGALSWGLPDLEAAQRAGARKSSTTAAAATVAAAVVGASGRPVAPGPGIRSILAAHGRLFLTVGLGVLLVSAVRSSRQVVIPLWAEHLGLDATATSLIYGLSGAIDMLVFYPAGKVMDRKGRVWVAVPCMAIMGVSLLLMPLTGGATSLLLVSLLIGFGNGIGSGMIMTLGADYSPSPGRAQFLGIWRFISDLGGSGGPALLSAVTALATLSIGIGVTGLLGLAAAVVLWYWVPRTPRWRPGPGG
ncbi:MFS transporter [Arthrobacter sp. 35W]|uniref:MFS transporter n=1 Tax=Arthrobacter sp. 35W TaxID=1132441 RepID=UPI00047891F2|nr:MFS transporter [Arthrobacter sp. 35W]